MNLKLKKKQDSPNTTTRICIGNKGITLQGGHDAVKVVSALKAAIRSFEEKHEESVDTESVLVSVRIMLEGKQIARSKSFTAKSSMDDANLKKLFIDYFEQSSDYSFIPLTKTYRAYIGSLSMSFEALGEFHEFVSAVKNLCAQVPCKTIEIHPTKKTKKPRISVGCWRIENAVKQEYKSFTVYGYSDRQEFRDELLKLLENNNQ